MLKKCEYCKSYSHFFSKKLQHICISLDVNVNESLTNDIISFEQLGPEFALSTWRNNVSLAIRNVPSEDSDQTAQMLWLIVFLLVTV